ncbi:MFS transporter [Streptomyces antimycoticus]|uniref:MFS transporter n=1 Tax=Streptomyces antimycoticus TaxID=68175 RepID=UPI000A3CD362|nr:MFS transporter [Streptomyces antimycoticus]
MEHELAETSEAATDRRYRAHRLMATIAAFGMMVTVSTVAAAGFTVIPGTERFDVGAGRYLIWYSVFTLSNAAVYTYAGKLLKRHGARAVSITGSIGVAASFLGMGTAPNLTVFYAWSAVLGVSWTGCTYLVSTHLTTVWHTHARRGTVVGLVATGFSFGGFLWGLVFPPIVSATGFTGAFVAIAAFVTLFAVLPALFMVREPREPVSGPTRKAESTAPTDPGHGKHLMRGFGIVTALLGAAFFLFALESAFVSVQPAVYDNLHVDATTAGFLVSVYSVSGLIAKPVLGYLHDRLGVIALYSVLVGLFVLGLPMIALFGHLGDGFLFLLLPVAALSLSVPTIIVPLITVRAVGQARFAVVYGLTLSAFAVGLAVALPLWGLTYDLTGSYSLAMFGGAGLGIVGVGISYAAYRVGRDRHPAPTSAVPEPAHS